MRRVGIWIRVSTEDQAQGESPAHHEKRARLYAEAKGWEVVTVYDLSGVSGKSVVDHPEAKRLMGDIRAKTVTALIFSKLARLARNTRELLDFADFFRDQNADLVSLQESIDTSSPAGRLFYTMIAAMAQWEREEISERVAASVPIRAKLGKAIGGQPTFGYAWVEGKLVPHPDEAPVRKLIYELFLEHKRKKTVARILNERGYRTRAGAQFSDTTITRLLRDPTPKGVHRANWTKSSGIGKRAVAKPESEWILREVPAIVSDGLWAHANALLDSQANKTPSRKVQYLFSGFLKCGCGHPMYVKRPTPRYVCRACNRKIETDDVEAIFRNELQNFFLSDSELDAFLSNEDDEIRSKQELVEVLESDRRKLEREADRVYRAYIDGNLTSGEFGDLHRPLKQRREQMDDQIVTLTAEIDLRRINRLSSDEVISGARDLYGRWDKLAFEEKRSIVEAIVEGIVVGDAIEINLSYLPQIPASELAETGQRINTDSSPPSAPRARGK